MTVAASAPTRRPGLLVRVATAPWRLAKWVAVAPVRAVVAVALFCARHLRGLSAAAAVATYLLIVAGGVVRVSGSGLGCGVKGQDWPFCHGRLVPLPDFNTLVEFSHRMLATISSVLVVLVLVGAWTAYRRGVPGMRTVARLATAVAVLLVVQILLGAVTVELRLPGGIVLAHLANALLLLGVLIAAAVALRRPAGPLAPQTDRQRSAARMMAWAAGATYVLVLSGGLVVANGAGYACKGWPLCGNGFQLDGGHLATINVLHRFVAGAVALLLGWSVAQVMRAFKGSRPVRIAAMAVNLALLLQITAGAVLVELRLPPATRGAHEALASLLWATAALLALLVRPGAVRLGGPTGGRRNRDEESQPARARTGPAGVALP